MIPSPPDRVRVTYGAAAAGCVHVVAHKRDTLPVGPVDAQLLPYEEGRASTARATPDSDADCSASASRSLARRVTDPERESVSADLSRDELQSRRQRLAEDHGIKRAAHAGPGRAVRIANAGVDAAVAAQPLGRGR
jgi:pyruvate/2-oxoglutarate dehydrogenase complex dihydrolipoamide acyltransferase (E2) component